MILEICTTSTFSWFGMNQWITWYVPKYCAIPCVGKPLAIILQMKSKVPWNIIHLDNFRLPIFVFYSWGKVSEWVGRAKERIPQWVAYSWPCLLNAPFFFSPLQNGRPCFIFMSTSIANVSSIKMTNLFQDSERIKQA